MRPFDAETEVLGVPSIFAYQSTGHMAYGEVPVGEGPLWAKACALVDSPVVTAPLLATVRKMASGRSGLRLEYL